MFMVSLWSNKIKIPKEILFQTQINWKYFTTQGNYVIDIE